MSEEQKNLVYAMQDAISLYFQSKNTRLLQENGHSVMISADELLVIAENAMREALDAIDEVLK